ncbi:unnamed protein product [Echinostoma caproni]|uniref:Uncharacterized protein n=1 Tax=Echinostoma caproni TaxID=27848 RepID=A0A3P8H1N8_9TREM|nr:unnamed protein product [Echinostoma caproni]
MCRRLVRLINEHAQMSASQEASMKQAQNASAAAEKWMKAATSEDSDAVKELKEEIEELQHQLKEEKEVETNHTVNVTEAFRLLYWVRGRLSRQVRCRMLATGEAVGIRLHNPSLCAQKQFLQALKLPWPTPYAPYIPSGPNDPMI